MNKTIVVNNNDRMNSLRFWLDRRPVEFRVDGHDPFLELDTSPDDWEGELDKFSLTQTKALHDWLGECLEKFTKPEEA